MSPHAPPHALASLKRAAASPPSHAALPALASCAPPQCFLEPHPVSSALATKRAVARHIGTTYGYDFRGFIEKALLADWQKVPHPPSGPLHHPRLCCFRG